MRAQYHFRPGPDGLRAWDMRKIVAQCAHLPVRDVPLSEIAELDEDWWFAHGGTATPRALAAHMAQVAEVDRTFPIVLDAEGRLMDGMHRVVQALLAGAQTVRAVQLAQTPAPDFVGVAPGDLPYGDDPARNDQEKMR